jgi:carboxypeptidase C (cathepsin A)
MLALTQTLAAPADELVSSLPIVGDLNFNAYSGYVDIADTTKEIHYLMVESQNDPTTDPLIVWFNGGPGCSSLIGFTTENGPYTFAENADPIVNEYSWNQEANILYIEQPAGVGFSYCNSRSDCKSGDDQSAEDNLAALLAWYEKFPEFKEHELYLSGESYAGIYVPLLASQIHNHNQNASESDYQPNLKGFMVGNGVTDWKYDTQPAFIEMGFQHGLYSTTFEEEKISLNCDFSYVFFNDNNISWKCKQWMN